MLTPSGTVRAVSGERSQEAFRRLLWLQLKVGLEKAKAPRNSGSSDRVILL
jgi:hypothetical protein